MQWKIIFMLICISCTFSGVMISTDNVWEVNAVEGQLRSVASLGIIHARTYRSSSRIVDFHPLVPLFLGIFHYPTQTIPKSRASEVTSIPCKSDYDDDDDDDDDTNDDDDDYYYFYTPGSTETRG